MLKGGPAGALRGMHPGWFASVMATGIVAEAMASVDRAWVASTLLGLALAAFTVLVCATLVRAIRYPDAMLADAVDPARAFEYLTFVAAGCVLSSCLSPHHLAAAMTLLAVSGISWVVLCYGIPAALMLHHGPRSALSAANGTWFLWVVAAQAISVAVTSLPGQWPTRLAVPAVACWSIGIVLYLILATLIFVALFMKPISASDLAPAYWVFMGATAISVLAGARLHQLPDSPMVTAMRPTLTGLSVVLWAFGSWLIPLLLIGGIWRHMVRHVQRGFDPGLWSMVFPIGMYGLGTRELGTTIGSPWMTSLAGAEAWIALIAWASTFIVMLIAPLKSARSHDADEAAASARDTS